MLRKIIIISLLLCSFWFTSCRKNQLDYQYVGVYIEILKNEAKTMDDRNLKLYYNPKNNVLEDINQIYEYRLKTESISKDIKQEKEKIEYYFGASYSIIGEIDEVKIYLIVLEDQEYKILDSDSKTLKLEDNKTKSITINKEYYFKKKEYNFQTIIKVLKKEG